MFLCPATRTQLEAWYSNASDTLYPLLDGVPVLVPKPYPFLRRHGPWDPSLGVAGQTQEILTVQEPDAVTPFLTPDKMRAGGAFGDFLLDLGSDSPDHWLAGQATLHAPDGAAVDMGCGLGGMALRMALQGRTTAALDLSPNAVLLARDLLTGRMREALIPTHRRGAIAAHVPIPQPVSHVAFAIADVRSPPLPRDSFAWVHLGFLLDVLSPEDQAQALLQSVQLLARGGVLTVSTAYGGDYPHVEGESDPSLELREVFRELNLLLVEERDHVPHVRRSYDRSFTVQLADCLVLRRI
jgi:SAM-dependent methyltransferase